MLAEKLLGSGLKGLFYAAMFATIMSTSNSFFFLSATTISKDLLFRFSKDKDERKLKPFAYLGIIITAVISITLVSLIPSVIDLWYAIGTVCIPGLILPVVSSYYPKLKISALMALIEVILAFSVSLCWMLVRDRFSSVPVINELEPMIMGLFVAVIIHLWALLFQAKSGVVRLES